MVYCLKELRNSSIEAVITLLFLVAALLNVSVFSMSDQLFVLTIPKSGTFLTARAIRMMTGVQIKGSPLRHDYFTDDFLDKHPKIATTAHLVERFEPLRTNQNVKRILVVRDLRDVCVSALYWLQENDWYSYAIDHSEFYKSNFDGRLSYMINMGHPEFSMKSFARRAIRWMRTPGVLVVRFEDLIGEKGGGSKESQLQTLKNIAEYLKAEVSQETLENVAENLWGGGGTFRKGLINSWRSSFNEHHKSLFKQILGEELVELGYEKDLYWN